MPGLVREQDDGPSVAIFTFDSITITGSITLRGQSAARSPVEGQCQRFRRRGNS